MGCEVDEMLASWMAACGTWALPRYGRFDEGCHTVLFIAEVTPDMARRFGSLSLQAAFRPNRAFPLPHRERGMPAVRVEEILLEILPLSRLCRRTGRTSCRRFGFRITKAWFGKSWIRISSFWGLSGEGSFADAGRLGEYWRRKASLSK